MEIEDPSQPTLLAPCEPSNEINDQEKQVPGLKRQVSLAGMVAFLVGAIIGARIFASPRSVATHSGSAGGILIMWVAAGGIAVTGALIFCELALTFPNNCAAQYTYVFEAFRDFPAFINLYLEVGSIAVKCCFKAASQYFLVNI